MNSIRIYQKEVRENLEALFWTTFDDEVWE